MISVKQSFEQRIFILKCYRKCENGVEVQRQLRREFHTGPPTRLTITRIRDNFQADRTVLKRSGRPRTSTIPTRQERVLETYVPCLRKSVRQVGLAIGISKAPVQRIGKRYQWKIEIPR